MARRNRKPRRVKAAPKPKAEPKRSIISRLKFRQGQPPLRCPGSRHNEKDGQPKPLRSHRADRARWVWTWPGFVLLNHPGRACRILSCPSTPDSVMIKPVLQLAAVGLVGIALVKLAGLFLLPVFFFLLKVLLIAGLIMLAFWFFNKKDRGKEDTPPPA